MTCSFFLNNTCFVGKTKDVKVLNTKLREPVKGFLYSKIQLMAVLSFVPIVVTLHLLIIPI